MYKEEIKRRLKSINKLLRHIKCGLIPYDTTPEAQPGDSLVYNGEKFIATPVTSLQGEPGADGSVGERGTQGEIGPAGADGQNGADGETIDKQLVVSQASELSGTLRSDVIYLIDGVIDLGATEIVVPETGLFIKGLDYFVSGLTSSVDGHTMFKTASGGFAGNVKITDLSFTTSGLGSKIFELDNQQNNGAIEFNSVNLGDFSSATTSLGILSNYRQFRTNDCGFFRLQDGLIFAGVWAGGFKISDTIVLAQAPNSTLFKAEVGLTFAGRSISDINAASVDPTTTTFDFIPDNFLLNAGFQLSGASFAPNSSISVTTDETSIKAFFRDCIEIRNTRPGFETTWTTNTTTPLVLNTPAKALGTTITTNNTWFTQTNDNEITYNSTLTKDLRITAPITIDGNPNREIALILRKWDNISSTYETIKSKIRPISNLQGGNDVGFYNLSAVVDDIKKNDRIEIWLENLTDSSDVIVQAGSEIIADVL